jgi:hypothetical protein
MLTCSRCGGLTPPDSSTTCLHCDARLRAPRWALRVSSLLGPAGAILLAACYGAPGRYYAVRDPGAPPGATRYDHDRDGAAGPYACAPGDAACEAQLAQLPPPSDLDCDDASAARFPNAPDVDGDGIDSNCDGVDGWRDPRSVIQPVSAELVVEPPAPAQVAVPPGPAQPAHVVVPAGGAQPAAPSPPRAVPAGPAQPAAPPASVAAPAGPSRPSSPPATVAVPPP